MYENIFIMEKVLFGFISIYFINQKLFHMQSFWITFPLTLIVFSSMWSNHTKAKPFLEKNQLLSVDLPPKGFGKFYVTIRYIEECVSSPIDEDNISSFKLIVKKHNETFEEFTGYVYLPNTFKAVRGKFTPMLERNGILKPTFNKTSENPCEDIVMSIPLTLIFNTDRSCIFHKGNYTAQKIDPNKVIHLVFGENFMYERVHAKLEYFTKTGSTFCLYIVLDIRPIPKFKRNRKN